MTETPQNQEEVTLGLQTLTSESSRRAFLGKLMVGAAGATALAAVPKTVFGASGQFKYAGAGIPKSDADILNYALTLEHLEARFYETAATKIGSRYGMYTGRLIRILRFDEESHVNALTAAIKQFGYTPVAAAPRYNLPAVFGSKAKFLDFAATVEDAGVHAYLGQAGNFKTPALLLTAASILTVEARHVGAVRAMLQRDPSDGPFDKGLNKAQILAIAGPLIGK